MIDFAADTAAIFGDVLAEDAIYTPVGGSAVAIRVMRSRPDGDVGFGGGRIVSPTATFKVQVSSVAAPGRDDTILCGGITYRVQGQPVRDERHLRWTIEARPE